MKKESLLCNGEHIQVFTEYNPKQARDFVATLEAGRQVDPVLTGRIIYHNLTEFGIQLNYISDQDYQMLVGDGNATFSDRIHRLLELKMKVPDINTLHMMIKMVPLWERMNVMRELLHTPERWRGKDFVRMLDTHEGALWPMSDALVLMLKHAVNCLEHNAQLYYTDLDKGELHAEQLREYANVIDSVQKMGLRDGLFGAHYDIAVRKLNTLPIESRPLGTLCEIALDYISQGDQAPAKAVSTCLHQYTMAEINACIDKVSQLCLKMTDRTDQWLGINKVIETQIRLNQMHPDAYRTLLPSNQPVSAQHLIRNAASKAHSIYMPYIDIEYALDTLRQNRDSDPLQLLDPKLNHSNPELNKLITFFNQEIGEALKNIIKNDVLKKNPDVIISEEGLLSYNRDFLIATAKTIQALELDSLFYRMEKDVHCMNNPLSLIDDAIDAAKPFLKKSMLSELQVEHDGITLHHAISMINELALSISKIVEKQNINAFKKLTSMDKRVERINGYIFKTYKKTKPEMAETDEIEHHISNTTL
jgi:hypothetical protein